MLLLILDASNSQHQRAWNMTERGGLLVGRAAPLQPTLCATRHAVRCPLFCGACPTSSCVV